MINFLALFRELFPTFVKYDSYLYYLYSVELYDKVELDVYTPNSIKISIIINLRWKKLTKGYAITELRLKKLKELHGQLSNPF